MSRGDLVVMTIGLSPFCVILCLAYIDWVCYGDLWDEFPTKDWERNRAIALLCTPLAPLLLLVAVCRGAYHAALGIGRTVRVAFCGSRPAAPEPADDPLLREAEREVEELLKEETP